MLEEEYKSAISAIPLGSVQPPKVSLPSAPSRRYSVNTARRPLRSSPLAGPSVSSIESFIETDEMSTKAKPSRIFSTTDLPMLSQSHRSSSSQSLDTIGAFPSPPSSSPFPQFSRRPSLGDNVKYRPPDIDTSLLSSPATSISAPTTPLHSPKTPSPEPSASSNRRPRSRDSFMNERYQAITPPPNFPRVLSRESSDNWLTANPYSSTPRFSRLSLAAPDVVLPVSARSPAGKRMSVSPPARLASASVNSLSSLQKSSVAERERESLMGTIQALQSPSLPSLSRSRTRSDSCSSRDEVSLYEAGRSPDIGTLETAVGRDLTGSTSSTVGRKFRKPSLSSIGWGPKHISLQKYKSDAMQSSKHTKGRSFLAFGSDDTHEASVNRYPSITDCARLTEESVSEVEEYDLPPLFFTAKRTENTRSSEKAQAFLGIHPAPSPTGKARTFFGVDSVKSEPKLCSQTATGTVRPGTVRRLWKTLSNVGRKQ